MVQPMNGTKLRSVTIHDEALSQAIARRLRGLIAERRLSSSEVAHAIGMTQQAFSRRTTGQTPFTLDEVDVLAGVLNESIVWLLTGVKKDHPGGPDEGLTAGPSTRQYDNGGRITTPLYTIPRYQKPAA